jgi:biopolymer transport protein ExbB/TolQ
MRSTDALLEFKQLCALKSSLAKAGEIQHHDKLQATKQRERELKEAIKAQREMKKQEKEEAKHKEQAANKFERIFYGTSKRAARDLREAMKREARRETGQTCQHGVWKCRICFPVTKSK